MQGGLSRIVTGQVLLILCCLFYLIWWYRGYRPGTEVDRIGGINGLMLFATVVLGAAGIVLSILGDGGDAVPRIHPVYIIVAGIAAYIALLLITKFLFHRIVTTELILIVGWTMLEVSVISRLSGAGLLSDGRFLAMGIVIAAAFMISIVMYVAYYRMEEMKAFYGAMAPLVTGAAVMLLLLMVLKSGR